jgi:hypothetical protein
MVRARVCGPGSSPDSENPFCSEDFQDPGQRALRAQQHQVAAALSQRFGGKQEQPDARRIGEIQLRTAR